METELRSSAPLFNALASKYDDHFSVPYRRAYDNLAWQLVQPLLPKRPGCIIDAGCGIGRWARRLADLGHRIIGIEPADQMAAIARQQLAHRDFLLIEQSMETATLSEGCAELTLALGSLQYTRDPEGMICRLANWTRVGRPVVVLVDSMAALVLELTASGKIEEALHCVRSRKGTWMQGEYAADNHLFDSDRLLAAFAKAGLADVRSHGLLVGFSLFGRERLTERLSDDWDAQLRLELELADIGSLANLGKHLLVHGRRA